MDSVACGIFPDQGLNPCLLHWQADSLPLSHQGSPILGIWLHCIKIFHLRRKQLTNVYPRREHHCKWQFSLSQGVLYLTLECLLQAIQWSNHLKWWPPSQHYHASVIAHLNYHTCLGIPKGPERCGLWQNGHLSVFAKMMLMKRHVCAADTGTLSFQCNLLHLQLPSLPLASVKVHGHGWVTASAPCTPLTTNAVFLGQACHDSFLP